MSGTEWPVTLSDILLALGILLLLFEVIKGARPGAKYLTDHLLSLMVFGGAAAEFVLLAEIRHLDLFPADAAGAGGFPVRHCACARGAERRSPSAAARQARAARKPTPAPSRTPIRARARTPAASRSPAGGLGADAVLTIIRTPKSCIPRRRSRGPSPEVPSPGLQPGNGAPPSPDAPPR